MKRFFCTKCNRIRRARRLPRNVSGDSNDPRHRIGTCNLHEEDKKPRYERRDLQSR